MVRCANCSHSWFQEPPEDYSLKALPQYSAGVSTISELTVGTLDRPRRHHLLSQAAGWAALSLAVMVMVLIAAQYRVEIVRLWPQAATLYAAFGETVNTRGLVFQQTHYEREYQGGVPVLAIKGQIVNTSAEAQPIPPVRVSLRNAEEREIFNWTFLPDQREVAPGEATTFITRLSNPPAGAQDMIIRFASLPEPAADTMAAR